MKLLKKILIISIVFFMYNQVVSQEIEMTRGLLFYHFEQDNQKLSFDEAYSIVDKDSEAILHVKRAKNLRLSSKIALGSGALIFVIPVVNAYVKRSHLISLYPTLGVSLSLLGATLGILAKFQGKKAIDIYNNNQALDKLPKRLSLSVKSNSLGITFSF